MSQVFISYAEEDADIVLELVRGLEGFGLSTWYYHRDSLPGPSYLSQIAAAIESCQAIIVLISNDSIGSRQITSEIVRGFELGKPFVPVLWGIGHADFQMKQPEWRGALQGSTSIQIPAEGVGGILPRVLRGLQAMGIEPARRPTVTPQAQPPAAAPRVQLTATFDYESYPAGDDPLAYCLLELLLQGDEGTAAEGVDADLALVLDVSGSMDRPNRYPFLLQAVQQLVAGLAPTDRVSITLFSDRAETVVSFIAGSDALDQADELIACMNRSKLKFGPKTMLAPGLRLALDSFGPAEQNPARVRRVYVLTDGELHDTPDCENALEPFRARRTEVHVYGFGEDFNAAALKRLVSDQMGGTVKPICREQDIVRTFAHVARVNRQLLAQEGKLTVRFSPDVVCGDAWVFKPAGRYLGTIQERRLEHTFGGLEAGRAYALLLEVRLPEERMPATAVAAVQASWTQGGKATTQGIEVTASRCRAETPGAVVPTVARAFDVLNVLRHEQDPTALLASLKARLELAELEKRDPGLLAALAKMIANLTEAAAGKSADHLTAREQQYVNSEPLTWDEGMVAVEPFTPQEQQYLDASDSTDNPPPPGANSPAPSKTNTSAAARAILDKYMKRPKQ